MPQTEPSSGVREAHSWLDKDFFQTALRKAENDPQLKVNQCQVYAGTNAGDNYATIVYRATVDVQTKTVNKGYKLVIKCVPENELRREFVKDMDIFLKEVTMYEMVFPTFEEFHRSKGITSPLLSCIPRCLYTIMDEEKDAIVLEDLGPLGFKMGERKKGLDFNHCKLVFCELGKFHALSFAMKNENLELFQEKFKLFGESIYCEANREKMTVFIGHQMENIVSTVKTFAGYEKFIPKLEELKETVFDKYMEFCCPQEPVSVLNHGDCWVNNMLFSYNNETVSAVKLLDFQIARYASPVLDLIYFLYTSTTKQLRDEHLEELLKIYHSTFDDTVRKLGSNPDAISFEVLKREFESKLLFGFLIACNILPLVLAEDVAIPDLDSITEENLKNPETLNTSIIFGNPKLHERLKDMLDEIGHKVFL